MDIETHWQDTWSGSRVVHHVLCGYLSTTLYVSNMYSPHYYMTKLIYNNATHAIYALYLEIVFWVSKNTGMQNFDHDTTNTLGQFRWAFSPIFAKPIRRSDLHCIVEHTPCADKGIWSSHKLEPSLKEAWETTHLLSIGIWTYDLRTSSLSVAPVPVTIT